jgi:hypothetical protein
MSSTKLSSPATYDVSNMIFGKAIEGSAGTASGTGPKIKYFRIPISTTNSDGSVGELVFQTPKLFSFGVSKIMDQESGKVTGMSLPLCMWNKDGATEDERAFSDVIEQIVEKCKDHLVLDETKVEVKKFNLKRDGLDSLGNFLYRKRDEKGKILEDRGPVMYPKLIESRKNGVHKIVTNMFDQNGRDIDPLSLEKKYCWVNAAIKIESIYVGSKISLQVKVYEAEVNLVESGARRLLQRPRSDATVVSVPSSSTGSAPLADMGDGAEEEDEEQIHDDESRGGGAASAPEPVVSSPPPAPASTPVRKIVRKIVPGKK